ncbi:hypothetical protein Tco_0538026 [Tanacetum coccineum]
MATQTTVTGTVQETITPPNGPEEILTTEGCKLPETHHQCAIQRSNAWGNVSLRSNHRRRAILLPMSAVQLRQLIANWSRKPDWIHLGKGHQGSHGSRKSKAQKITIAIQWPFIGRSRISAVYALVPIHDPWDAKIPR